MAAAGGRSHFAPRFSTRVARTALLRIGILLGVMPRMLHDVVRDVLRGEEDLRIVAESVEVDVVAEHVERERPDVVVLAAQSGSPPAVCAELLSRFPRLTVVTLEDRGERASIYTQRPIRFRIDELSGPRLVTAIRRAAVPTPILSSVYDVEKQTSGTASSPAGEYRAADRPTVFESGSS
jgi:DNA-binding NarL/FixJ family response regulator